MTTVYINVAALRAAARVMSTDEPRFFLNGVCVEATETDTVLFSATAHSALMIRTEAQNKVKKPIRITIPHWIVSAAICGTPNNELVDTLALKKKKERWAIDSFLGGNLSTVVFDQLGGEFPKWEKQISKSVTGEAAHFNPMLLEPFRLAAMELGAAENGGIQLMQNGLNAASVYLPKDPRFFGLIMPFNPRLTTETPPEWVLKRIDKAEEGRSHEQR